MVKKGGMKKAMKKLAKGVPKLLWKRKVYFQKERDAVLAGKKAKTASGLRASDLAWNKQGKAVSKKLRARGKNSRWLKTVGQARKNLGLKGFQAVGGSTATGQKLHNEARRLSKQ